MVINGRLLADEVLSELSEDIQKLREKNKIPKLAIITLGDEGSWKAYVNAKVKTAKRIGIEAMVINLSNSDQNTLINTIEKLSNDDSIHGLIVQRPFPQEIDKKKVINSVRKEKDVDGFRQDSLFTVPVLQATLHIIRYVSEVLNVQDFQNWLSNQQIVVVGKGETAGNPVIKGLKMKNCQIKVVDSSTKDRKKILQNGAMIISAVGKNKIITSDDISQGVILIGIGIHSENGKLVGDYDEESIKHIASFYTPTPGGVGPLNLAYLFKNVVQAAKSNKDSHLAFAPRKL